MSAVHFAEALGVEESDLAKIESGDLPVTAHQLAACMRILDVDLDALTDPFRLDPGEGRWHFHLDPNTPEETK